MALKRKLVALAAFKWKDSGVNGVQLEKDDINGV